MHTPTPSSNLVSARNKYFWFFFCQENKKKRQLNRTHEQLEAEARTSSILNKVQCERPKVKSVPCCVGSDAPQYPKRVFPLG